MEALLIPLSVAGLAALLLLADDPALAARMGRDAFATARERFTPAAMAAGHEQVYADAIATRSR